MQRLRASLVLVVLFGSAGPAMAVTSHVQVHTPRLKLGAVVLDDVTVTVHARGTGSETCVDAWLGATRIAACGTIETVRDQVMLRRGRAALTISPRTGAGATLARTTITAQISGNLSTLDLSLRGTVETTRAELHSHLTTATLTDVELPFAVHVHRVAGALAIEEDAPLVVRVGEATLAAAGAIVPFMPTIILHAGWPTWHADIAWTGLEIGPAFAAASRARIAGSGTLSGELSFKGERATVTLARGVAVSMGGDLRLTDAALRDRLVSASQGKVAIQYRVAAALADFHYGRLALVFGADPVVKIALAGRGKRVAQDLDLTVNVRSHP